MSRPRSFGGIVRAGVDATARDEVVAGRVLCMGLYWWSWLADGVPICPSNLDLSPRDKLDTTPPRHASMGRHHCFWLAVGPLRVDRSSACFIGLARIQVIYGPHPAVLRAQPTRGRGRIDIYDLPFTASNPSHPPPARPPSQASRNKLLLPARTTGRLGKVI